MSPKQAVQMLQLFEELLKELRAIKELLGKKKV